MISIHTQTFLSESEAATRPAHAATRKISDRRRRAQQGGKKRSVRDRVVRLFWVAVKELTLSYHNLYIYIYIYIYIVKIGFPRSCKLIEFP